MQHVVGAIGTAMLFYGVYRFSEWLALALAGLAIVTVANKMGQQKRHEAMHRHPTNSDYKSGADPRGEATRDDIR